jgi:8-oxo-dGTP diphosphatase
LERFPKVRESIDHNVVVLVAVAVVQNGKVLMIKEEDRPYYHQWILPQGYPKRNETMTNAAIREVREELEMNIDILGLVGVYDDFAQEGDATLHYVIVCYLGQPAGDPQIHATSEVIDWAWRDPTDEFSEAMPIMHKILKDVAAIKPGRYPFGRIEAR